MVKTKLRGLALLRISRLLESSMSTKQRVNGPKRRGQTVKAQSAAGLAEVARATSRLWRKHHLSYDQTNMDGRGRLAIFLHVPADLVVIGIRAAKRTDHSCLAELSSQRINPTHSSFLSSCPDLYGKALAASRIRRASSSCVPLNSRLFCVKLNLLSPCGAN
jgi:hypothetical protein